MSAVTRAWRAAHRALDDTLGLALLVVVLAVAALWLWRAALLAVGR